jgi:hypothetical protein
MKKDKAMAKARQWKEGTGEDAYVLDMGGTFEWYGESFFDNGYEGGTVVWSTSWTMNY